MRFKGVRVDLEKADNIKNSLMHKEKKILHKIKSLTGVDVEIMAARSIAKAFDKLKLPYDRTEKSKEPSFTKNFLQNHPHELAKSIAEARSQTCLLYTSPSPRDRQKSRMPSSA